MVGPHVVRHRDRRGRTDQRASTGAILDQAVDERPAVLVLDITAVTFLSSAGLAVLVRTHRNSSAVGALFRVVANNPATLRPIQLMGLDREFEVFADGEGALVGAAGL
ncbi:STAS domain-containing protein [Saccharopolyspora terrae]|uniref:STAS domain-containing protein n=1 Tax=Saccharopolyspora terrae TaxID=2530384 RepID=UPI001405212E|nr:STAS domain-containing protein [Saccharopolyspora terrae]